MRMGTIALSLACLLLPAPAPYGEDRPGPDLARVAGEYYRGDGLGENDSLTITRSGRFLFDWHPDVGIPYHNEGTARIDGRHLILRPDRPDPHRLIAGVDPPALSPVRWGKRVYLVAERELLAFCNAVNLGIEPRSGHRGRFYVRVLQDRNSRAGLTWPSPEPVDGRPELPPAWRTYLLSKPVEGQIIDVEAGKGASVDLGSRDGIRTGMVFWTEGTGANNLVVVKSVETASCQVEAPSGKRDWRLERGQVVRSRIPPNRLKVDAP